MPGVIVTPPCRTSTVFQAVAILYYEKLQFCSYKFRATFSCLTRKRNKLEKCYLYTFSRILVFGENFFKKFHITRFLTFFCRFLIDMHPEIRLSFCVTEKFLILELFLFSISIEIYAITVKVRKEVRNWPNLIGHF